MAEAIKELLERDEAVAIHFEEGLCGFEDILEYSLQRETAQDPVMILQAAEYDVPSFVLVNPFLVCEDYKPVPSAAVLSRLDAHTCEDVIFFTIAVVKADYTETVVNLKSPLVVNRKTGAALQVVLDDCDYPIRYPIFAKKS